MMLQGGVPIKGPMASRILKRLKRGKNPEATVVAHALARMAENPIELAAKLRVIEFKSWDQIDASNWGDVYGYVDTGGRRRKGIAHKTIAQAEFGGRLASDLHDAVKNNRWRSSDLSDSGSARVGKFKITENSPNTARITVGPDQRERRKKYAWERVGFQRAAATAAFAGALYGGGKLNKTLIAHARGGDAMAGAKNIFKSGVAKVKRVFDKTVPEYTPPTIFSPDQTKKIAARVEKGRANLRERFPHGYIAPKTPHPTEPGKFIYPKTAAPIPNMIDATEHIQDVSGKLHHPDAGKDVTKKHFHVVPK